MVRRMVVCTASYISPAPWFDFKQSFYALLKHRIIVGQQESEFATFDPFGYTYRQVNDPWSPYGFCIAKLNSLLHMKCTIILVLHLCQLLPNWEILVLLNWRNLVMISKHIFTTLSMFAIQQNYFVIEHCKLFNWSGITFCWRITFCSRIFDLTVTNMKSAQGADFFSVSHGALRVSGLARHL